MGNRLSHLRNIYYNVCFVTWRLWSARQKIFLLASAFTRLEILTLDFSKNTTKIPEPNHLNKIVD